MNKPKILLWTGLLLGQLVGPFGGLPVRAKAEAPTVQTLAPMTPSDLLTQVWRGNVTLRQLRRDYARAQARLLQAGLLPNPELGMTAEDFAGSAAYTDDRFTQFTVEWAQSVPMGDRLGSQKRLAQLEAQLIGWEYRVQLLRLAREAYLGHSRQRYLAARLDLAQELLSNARETRSLIEIRVNAGKQPPIADLQARQQVITLEAEALELASQQRIAALELTALWGNAAGPELRVEGPLTSPVPLVGLDVYQQRLPQHPQIARWQIEGEQRQAALDAAQAQAQPDLTASGGLRYHPASDWGVVASVSLPIPTYDRNQGAIEDARLNQSSLAREREQDLLQLNSELKQTYETYQGAYARWQLYREQIQLAREEFRIAVIVFDAGKTGYLEVLQSQQSYFSARRSLIETHWELEQAQVALRTLTHDLDPIEDIPITEPEGEQKP